MPTDRPEPDAEAIRAALNRSSGPRVLQADAALDRLVARLEAAERERDEADEVTALRVFAKYADRLKTAERALRYIVGYDVAGYDAHLRSEDVARAALAAAAPGETEQTP